MIKVSDWEGIPKVVQKKTETHHFTFFLTVSILIFSRDCPKGNIDLGNDQSLHRSLKF